MTSHTLTESRRLYAHDAQEGRYWKRTEMIFNGKRVDAITLRDFVTQSYEYVNANKEELIICENEFSADQDDLGDDLEEYTLKGCS
ncbi:hypothetical protein PSPO01_13198 [Paraphaeosphaeria sporulosa]